MNVTLHINGTVHEVDAPHDSTLLGVLRDELGLLGTRFGCGHGVCGACYVLLDCQAVPACRIKLDELRGRPILTIEGLPRGERLHRVQQAFLEEDAMQCGYCTSGMIVSAVALLERVPRPSDEEIREALVPHLCRCGVYGRALRAVQRAALAASAP